MIYAPRGYLAVAPRAIGADFAELDGPPATQLLNGVAVVPVRGPLEQHTNPFFDSYDSIQARVCGALQASDVRAVVLQLDSPGGLVSGLFECARAIRAEAQLLRKPLVAYVDGMACSAAYALACAASQIAVTSTAEVGSIGIVVTMLDATVSDAQQGLRFELLTSGARKADGNPHMKITDAARAAAQQNVDLLASMFFDWVAETRSTLSTADVRGLQAGTYLGRLGIAAGLADAIGTLPAVVADAARPPVPTMAGAIAEARRVLASSTASTSERRDAQRLLGHVEAKRAAAERAQATDLRRRLDALEARTTGMQRAAKCEADERRRRRLAEGYRRLGSVKDP